MVFLLGDTKSDWVYINKMKGLLGDSYILWIDIALGITKLDIIKKKKLLPKLKLEKYAINKRWIKNNFKGIMLILTKWNWIWKLKF